MKNLLKSLACCLSLVCCVGCTNIHFVRKATLGNNPYGGVVSYSHAFNRDVALQFAYKFCNSYNIEVIEELLDHDLITSGPGTSLTEFGFAFDEKRPAVKKNKNYIAFKCK